MSLFSRMLQYISFLICLLHEHSPTVDAMIGRKVVFRGSRPRDADILKRTMRRKRQQPYKNSFIEKKVEIQLKPGFLSGLADNLRGAFIKKEFNNGDSVKIQGLKSKPEYNGQTGQVLSFDGKKKRYAVRMQNDNNEILLQAKNLQKENKPDTSEQRPPVEEIINKPLEPPGAQPEQEENLQENLGDEFAHKVARSKAAAASNMKPVDAQIDAESVQDGLKNLGKPLERLTRTVHCAVHGCKLVDYETGKKNIVAKYSTENPDIALVSPAPKTATEDTPSEMHVPAQSEANIKQLRDSQGAMNRLIDYDKNVEKLEATLISLIIKTMGN